MAGEHDNPREDGSGKLVDGDPAVRVVLGGPKDVEGMSGAIKVLNDFGVTHEVIHYEPEFLQQMDSGVGLIIAAAGEDPVLPVVLALRNTQMVVGVPLVTEKSNGFNNLLALAVFPTTLEPEVPIPLAFVGIGRADNAALLAVQMLALSDTELSGRYSAYRDESPAMVARQNEWLQGQSNTK